MSDAPSEAAPVQYREYQPGPSLAPYVACFWTLRDRDRGGAAAPERVLPDGCPEIVFNFAEPFRRFDDEGRERPQPLALLVGQMRRHIRIQPSGRVDLLGVRFHPYGPPVVLPIAMDEITDRIEDLSDVASKTRSLLDDLGGIDEPCARVHALEAELTTRLRVRVDPRALAAVGIIRASRGRASIDDVARRTGWSRRQLERSFRSHVGLGPKLLARITRLQEVIRRARSVSLGGWAPIAHACGYADQAHFVREFRDFSGQTPSAFFRGESQFAQLFAGEQ